MKRRLLFFVMMFALAGLFTMQSCNEDETSFTEFGSFTDPVLVTPGDGEYVNVTGTTVELQWESTDSDGDTEAWDVYFGTASTPPLVASGVGQQSYTADVVVGNDYYWRVIIKDSHGVITRSPIWSFSVVDPDADLVLTMSWDTDVLTAIGLDLDPRDVADMRLLILDPTDNSIIAEEDGSGFEEYADFNTLDDGTYLIATDIFSTIDAGDFNEPVSLDIDLDFEQLGTLSQTLSFPKVMDNLSPCSDYYTILAEVVKTGKTYTFTKSVSYAWSAVLADLVGTWQGVDNYGYDSQVVTTLPGTDLLIDGLAFEWMDDWWGEVIQSGNPVNMVFDWNSSGGVSIEDQYYLTTLYAGELYDYNIVGTGTFVTCGKYPVLILEFDLIQDGFSVGTWAYENGYAETEFFTTTITLDPDGKGVPSKGLSGSKSAKLITKPTH